MEIAKGMRRFVREEEVIGLNIINCVQSHVNSEWTIHWENNI